MALRASLGVLVVAVTLVAATRIEDNLDFSTTSVWIRNDTTGIGVCGYSSAGLPDPVAGSFLGVQTDIPLAGYDQCSLIRHLLQRPDVSVNEFRYYVAGYFRPRTAAFNCGFSLTRDRGGSTVDPDYVFPQLSFTETSPVWSWTEAGNAGSTAMTYPATGNAAALDTWHDVEVLCGDARGTCVAMMDGFTLGETAIPGNYTGTDVDFIRFSSTQLGQGVSRCDFDEFVVVRGNETIIDGCYTGQPGWTHADHLDIVQGERYLVHLRRPRRTGGAPFDSASIRVSVDSGTLQSASEIIVQGETVVQVALVGKFDKTVSVSIGIGSAAGFDDVPSMCSVGYTVLDISVPAGPGDTDRDPVNPIVIVGIAVAVIGVGGVAAGLTATNRAKQAQTERRRASVMATLDLEELEAAKAAEEGGDDVSKDDRDDRDRD